jgi:hypothetical protein
MQSGNNSYYGIWWLPSTPKHQITGTLSIDEFGKAYFFTIDSFKDQGDYDFAYGETTYDEVHGIATSVNENTDHSIILYGMKNIGLTSSVLTKSRYQIEKVIIGQPNPEEKGERFNTIMLFSQTWNWWFPMKGVEINSKEFSPSDGMSAHFKQPDLITLYTNDDLHVYVYYRGNFGVSQTDGVNILVQPFLNIESKLGWDIKKAHQLKVSIERFLMIIWRFPHQFDTFELRSIQETNFNVILDAFPNYTKQISRNHNFEDFKSTAQTLLGNWFRVNEELQNLINTFFFAYSSDTMDVQNRFLHYVFSLELYHRKRVKDKRSLKEKDEAMYEQALKEVKGETRDLLNKVYSSKRDIPIFDRITELFSMVLDKEGIELPNDTVRKIKDTRHYLVHLDEQYKPTSFTAEQLVNINNLLTQLFLRLVKQELMS